MKGEAESSMAEKKSSKKFLILGLLAVAVIAVISVVVVMTVKKKESYRTLEIIECVGDGTVYRGEKEIAAYEDMKLRSGDTITVGENSYVRMKFDDDKYVYLEGHALIKLVADGTKQDSRTIVDIELGTMITEVQNKLSDKSVYEINSPNTTMAIRGTITVSKVEYEIPEITDAAGESVQIQKKDVFEYIIKKNKLGKYSEKNTANKPGESDGTVQSPEDELLEETLAKVEEVFNSGVKAAVSSFVHEGKVELTTYEKKVQEDGTALLAAVKVPVEAGNGINTKVEEIIPAAVVSEIKADDNGKLTINRTEIVEEFLQDVVESVIEVQQVETIEELKEVLTEKIVEAIEQVEDLNLSINLNQGSISEVIQETQPAWNETITPMPTEAAVATEAPTPTEVPVATEALTPTEVPTPTEVQVPTENPSPTDLPTPTEMPVVTEVPVVTETPSPSPTSTPSPTPSPTATPSPSPTSTPSPTPSPTATPSPSPTSTPSAIPSPTATPSPSPTSTPSPIPSPTAVLSPTPTEAPAPTSAPVYPGESGEITPTLNPTPTATLSPTVTPSPSPSPTPTATPSPTPDPVIEQNGFQYSVVTGEKGEYYAVMSKYNSSATIVTIPDSITVSVGEESIEIPVTEVAEEAFVSCTGLTSINILKPVNGLADAINRVAGSVHFSELVVPATVVAALSNDILIDVTVLSVVPVAGFAMRSDSKVLFDITVCAKLQKLSLPVDLVNYVQLTSYSYRLISLTVVAGCDGSTVMPTGTLVKNMFISSLCMDGVSLPQEGYVFPDYMRTFVSKNVEEIPGNPLAETEINTNLYSMTLDGVKTIGEYAFANCHVLTEIQADDLEEVHENAFLNSATLILSQSQLEYSETENGICIEQVTIPETCTAYRLMMPSWIDGKPVTRIGSYAFSNVGRVTIVLPNSVEEITEYAFAGSEVQIVIAYGVKTIESYAFMNCSSFSRIETKLLESFGEYAFEACSNLQGVPALPTWFDYSTTTSGVVINGFSENYPKYSEITFPGWFNGSPLVQIADNAFEDNTNLEMIVLVGATNIGNTAFRNCDNLHTVYMFECKVVGKQAFYDCDGLFQINMNSVGVVGESAFENCNLLSSVCINSATEVGARAFAECLNLKTVQMRNVAKIGEAAFINCELLHISIPYTVTAIESQALVGIANKNLYIPSGAVLAADAVGEDVRLFAESGSLIFSNDAYSCEELPYPGRLDSYVGDLLAYTDTMAEPQIIYGKSTGDNRFDLEKTVSWRTYYYRIQQTSIDMAEEAFLQKAQLESSMPEEWSELPLGQVVFYPISGEYVTTIYVKSVDKSTGETLYYYSGMMTSAYSGGESGDDYETSEYSDENGSYIIYSNPSNGDAYAVLKEYSNTEQEYVVLPTIVNGHFLTQVGANAFAGNEVVKWVKLPETCTVIGEWAFKSCTSLCSVKMEEVKSIEKNAFFGCTALQEISVKNLYFIEENAFSGCTNLYISLPDTVQKIGTNALTSVANAYIYVPSDTVVEAGAFPANIPLYAATEAEIMSNSAYTGVVSYDEPRIRTQQMGDLLTYGTVENANESYPVLGTTVYFVFPENVSAYVQNSSDAIEAFEMMEPELISEWMLVGSPGTDLLHNMQYDTENIVYFKLITDSGDYYYRTGYISVGLPWTYEIKESESGELTAAITGYNGMPEESLEIPMTVAGYTVSSIASNAFCADEHLMILNISAAKCNVESGAFVGCPNLNGVFFANDAGSIEEGAFSDCPKLMEFEYMSAENIDAYAFVNCPSMYYQPLGIAQLEYTMGDMGYVIDGFAETYMGDKTGIYIPARINNTDVYAIGTRAFENETDLKRVYLGGTISVIEESAFANCTSLEFVVMPCVTSIQKNAFSGCPKLQPLLRDELTYIGNGAFDSITTETVFVPRNTVVEADAFGEYTGNIYTVADSLFAKAASGSVYNIVIQEDSLRMITLPGGTRIPGNYETVTETDEDIAKLWVWVEGVEEDTGLYAAIVTVAEGQTALDPTQFETYDFHQLSPTTSFSRGANGNAVVLLMKVVDSDGTTRYIVSDLWKVSQ